MPYYRCAACGLTTYSAAAHSTARTCPNCSVPLSDEARLCLAPKPIADIARTLTARPEAAADARRALVGLPLSQMIRAKLELLVSELVTNSIRHAGLAAEDPVRLRVTHRAGRVRIAVRDGGRGFAAPSQEGRDPLTPGGHGLLIVDAMSERWGIDCVDGCTVWCEVAVDDEPPAAVQHEVSTRHVREGAVPMWSSAPSPGLT
jgi:anti-sigma regulatory factor (Ser/Thr protein kinase)